MKKAKHNRSLSEAAEPRKPLVAPRVDLEKEADRALWEHSACAGLVVDDDLRILHIRGDTSPYVRSAPDQASLQLMRVLRPEILVEVRSAVDKMRRSGKPVRIKAIEIRRNDHTSRVKIELRPLVKRGPEKSFLILFEPTPAAPVEHAADAKHGRGPEGREVLRLRRELARTREYVESMTRDLATTNEELRTTNEAALSSNEELQSTNEKLETTNEELQSSNEELLTLSEQAQVRNAELLQLSQDLNHVLSGLDIAIVTLDSSRRIRRFTPPAEKLLGLIPGDLGRPIADLHLHVPVPDLDELISAVTEKGEEITREVQAESGHWFLLRVHPFRGNGQIEGVLIAFVDIHELKRQQEIERDKNFIAAILDAAKDLLVIVLDREGRIVHFNVACERLTGYSEKDARGRFLWDFLLPPKEAEAVKAAFQKAVAGQPVQLENHWIARDGRRPLISFSHTAVIRDGHVESVIKTGIDVSARQEANQRVQESEATVSALMENAIQAILTCGVDGRIVLANTAAEKMFGYQRNELMGRSLEFLLPKRFREVHEKHRATWFAKPGNRPMGIGLDLAGVRKDTSEFPVEVSLSYVDTRAGTLAVAFISDISDRKKSERTLLEYKNQLQQLTGALLTAQESGNRQVARELHDVFSQELAAIGMELSSLKEGAKSSDIRARLSDLGKRISRLAADIHRTSRELHPAILEELGLEPALRQECESFEQRSAIATQFTATNVPHAIPQEVALCLYRVAQESLHNIQKHAPESDIVRLSLSGGAESLTLRVEDTGNGFELDEALRKGGLGLISMEERVRLVHGKMTIESKPGKGTIVTAFVPLRDLPT